MKHVSDSAVDGDFNSLSMLVSFMPGSSNGSMVCVNVTVLEDMMVEREGNFTVELTLNTVGESLDLGNSLTRVILVDSDGNHSLCQGFCSLSIFFFAAAIFSIPSMEVVAESDGTLEVCVTMMTFPSGGSLAKDVDLTLSTMSGTGKVKKY